MHSEHLKDDLTQLVRLAIREDLDRSFDLTTVAVVPPGVKAEASIVARKPGIASGVDLVDWILEAINCSVTCEQLVGDKSAFIGGQTLAVLRGDARDVLTCERTVLNFLGRLCGIATWTRQHVDSVQGLKAQVYDTRKTTPGWRRLEKYAVRCGGGQNHRTGLFDAILVKDNHLACYHALTGHSLSPSEAVRLAREFVLSQPAVADNTIVEIEVDSLEQLADALPAKPDIVLLDNMNADELRQAVAMRDSIDPAVELEASGGVNLQVLRAIAETGVDRVSIGALTHSAINLDLGLDWNYYS